MKPATRRPSLRHRLPGTSTLLLGIGLSIAVAGLLALSYPSVADRRRNAETLAERRADVLLALLSAALDRDMKGAQVSVLLPFSLQQPFRESPIELRDAAARAFIRFPYPESFFLWSGRPGHDGMFHVLNRSDRPPPWDPDSDSTAAFPAVLRRNPVSARPLADAIRKHAAGSVRDLVFECALDGEPYQVVAKQLSDYSSEEVRIIGFTVNLRWAREHYFDELAVSVLRVRNESGAASIVITDDEDRPIASAGWRGARGPVLERRFSPVFFDPVLSSAFPAAPANRSWTARVEVAPEPTTLGARLPLGRLYLVLAATAVASVLGMLFTARTVLASAKLAEHRSEFISTVTHELKTPLASIRLLADTLGNGRYESADAIRDYAGLLSREAWRMTRLIDNLLAYGSVGSTRDLSTEKHEIAELLDEVVAHFHPQLSDQHFEVTMDVSPDLPRVEGDRTALLHALDNLVDNAIKYSTGCQRRLEIRTWAEDGHLILEVADNGQGVAPDELPHVFEKFYRGRGVRAGGSGLGLAIVKRVVAAHRGTVEMKSVPGEGTAVRVVLPRERDDA